MEIERTMWTLFRIDDDSEWTTQKITTRDWYYWYIETTQDNRKEIFVIKFKLFPFYFGFDYYVTLLVRTCLQTENREEIVYSLVVNHIASY